MVGTPISEPDSHPAELKTHKLEPEPVPTVEGLVFDEELIAKMFANLAAHGMTLEDLAN